MRVVSFINDVNTYSHTSHDFHRRMDIVMNKKIIEYIITTILFSWIFWLIPIIGGYFHITIISYHSPLGMTAFLLGGFSPAICELFLKRREGKEVFHTFLRTIINPKHSVFGYVYAVGGAILFLSIPAILSGQEPSVPFYMGFVMIIPMIIGGGLEEIGWRGFLQPSLDQKMTHILATGIVAVIWAVWHLPLWFMEGTGQYGTDFILFLINAVSLSFFLGSVQYLSKSIFLPIIAHATLNGFVEVYPSSTKYSISLIVLVCTITLTMLIDYFNNLRSLNCASKRSSLPPSTS